MISRTKSKRYSIAADRLCGAATRCRHAAVAALWVTLTSQLVGCASFTNPVANGIPAHMLPDELLAPSKEHMAPVDLTQLRQAPPEHYRLSAGDTVGVYVEGVLGNPETPPPVSVPDTPDAPPAIGYPFPVRANGTLSLPYVGEVDVDGLTIEEAEQRVIDAYLEEKIVRPEDYRIIITLFRPRYERVLVVREDSGQSSVSFSNQGLIGFGSSATISGGSSATGQVVELPAYENDVLNALARTGGLPGPDAIQEVVIYRSGRRDDKTPTRDPQGYEFPCDPTLNGGEVVRIPLEVPEGMPRQINPDHILLKTGDIVTIRAREPQLYYTGGLIPSGEYQLPPDRDVTVLEALLKARAPVVSGGLSTSNLNGSILGSGIGQPSPSLVSVIRKTPVGSQYVIRIDLNEALRDPRQNILVQNEDVLIMQESHDEALTRYITNAVSFDFFFRYLDRQDASGSGAILFP